MGQARSAAPAMSSVSGMGVTERDGETDVLAESAVYAVSYSAPEAASVVESGRAPVALAAEGGEGRDYGVADGKIVNALPHLGYPA